jgi:hypothetical protein
MTCKPKGEDERVQTQTHPPMARASQRTMPWTVRCATIQPVMNKKKCRRGHGQIRERERERERERGRESRKGRRWRRKSNKSMCVRVSNACGGHEWDTWQNSPTSNRNRVHRTEMPRTYSRGPYGANLRNVSFVLESWALNDRDCNSVCTRSNGAKVASQHPDTIAARKCAPGSGKYMEK